MTAAKRDAEPPDVPDPELRLDPARWAHVNSLVQQIVANEDVPAIAIMAGRKNHTADIVTAGTRKLQPDESGVWQPDTHPDAAADENTIFLVASLTKPIVATGVLQLIEQGEITLGDRVSRFLPEFGNQHKNAVTIRHLLTHTSGLPDMLPNNQKLRADEAPLDRFLHGTCGISLGFSPGRGVQYQSMGFVVLAEIITRVSGKPCAEFLRTQLLEPLGMFDTVLGMPTTWSDGQPAKVNRIADVWLPEERRAITGHWNSDYWKRLGAPWGGLLSTAPDLAKFCRMMLAGGRARGRQILNPQGVTTAIRNHLQDLRDIPAEDRRCRPWGLGWRLNWPGHEAAFSDFCSPETYGHWGATGTLMWIDPVREIWTVILTTRPQQGSLRHVSRLSNAVATAFLK